MLASFMKRRTWQLKRQLQHASQHVIADIDRIAGIMPLEPDCQCRLAEPVSLCVRSGTAGGTMCPIQGRQAGDPD